MAASPLRTNAMRFPFVLLLLLACSSAVRAQTVQKCVARNGQARYQSEPCAKGLRTAEVWDAVPDPVIPAASVRPAASPKRGRGGRSGRAQRTYATERNASPADCAQARAYRDQAERRAGLARNYELLSTLQRRVYDACR
jgi:hypothetical protein